MNLCDSKSHILPKTESFAFPKTETVETSAETKSLNFHKIKMEPFGKTEPLDFPKVEKMEQLEKTEPLDLHKTKTMKLFGISVFESNISNGQTRQLQSNLSRIRDYVNLLLYYPMKIVHESKLKLWIHEASYGHHELGDLYRLLNQKPLRYVEGLVPMEILEDVETGWNSMFAHKNVIPEAILNLAVDLAVHQLVRTLISGDDHVRSIHHVMLSTRNVAEKRLVMKKIETALKDKDNMLCLHRTFHEVLFIDASSCDSQIESHVQQQIAQQLQLQLPMIEEDEVKGSDDWLITSIEKEMSRKRYLVLLVDGNAEEPLDPRKVGFPKEELAGVVVLITTESSKQANDELTMAMDLKIGTDDHLLPWVVFCKTVGNELVLSSHAIQTIATRIVEECGSHLLALLLVAKSLKNVKDVKTWVDAVDKLRWIRPSYDTSVFLSHSTVMVNAFINFIWDAITKTQKLCLTYCLFIPNMKDGKLDNELINDWIYYLLMDAGEAKNNLRKFLDLFVLLQFKDNKSRYVLIPEDIYGILHSLNTHCPLFMKKVGVGLSEAPKSELWHSVVHVELADNKLSELPLSPNCQELKVLMLHRNTDLTKIPPIFFFKMPVLCILDLSYTSVRELPDSFFELEQLRELYMKGCECFMRLPPKVGKLKKLEKLDLDKTQITHLPEEIQELTNLQSLTLSFYEHRGKKSAQYSSSTIVPSGVISKLKELKHLSIDVNPDDERWLENVQVILKEILVLKYLQAVSLYIPQPTLLKLVPTCVFELDFRFVIGQHMPRIISGTPPKTEANFEQNHHSLKFVKGVDVPSEIKKLVRHSKALFLDRHMTIKDLSKFGMKNLQQLQVCILAECKEMQNIVGGRHSNSTDIFPCLLWLSVSYMKNLRSIWEGPVRSTDSFGMLKSLALHNCPKLKTVFTTDFVGNLSLLKVLIIKDCPKIITLISHGSSKPKGAIFLPKLIMVSLLHLPELISISNGFDMGPTLENIGIYDCPKLQSLSKMELCSQNLRVIKGETKWWEALKWSQEDWGKAGRPSKFDHIFSSIDTEADVMTQLGVDDDNIVDGPSNPINTINNKQSILTRVDYMDQPSPTCGGIVNEAPLQRSSDKVFKDQRRGTYRRKRTTTWWTKEDSMEVDDGHIWRKYGQKCVLGAKFPRNYYRCTHKFDQGCRATKQVQRIQEEPPLYRTTYYGHHTCTNLQNPEINFDFGSSSDSSNFLSFENPLPTKQDHPFVSSSLATVKEEIPSPSDDYQLSSELISEGHPFVSSSLATVKEEIPSPSDDFLLSTLDSWDLWDF